MNLIGSYFKISRKSKTKYIKENLRGTTSKRKLNIL